ncbi:MAG: NifB/NifX family molybdenum-iron cluster-binding protein [Candidatus Bathyarchaeota archaeon]|nr:NifB/NifX family molybdenum-iron cluster-binding protein [Candidatus Bathyarchaeota archaeon]MDH5623984.1 NifB/NifX family molybdenum-iron cluster-binding protein [Candidatus Bathyarchaeota archaeon]MDH5702109.1 NifB/NifX family molybdenum-iron cluster-binding protein [Candidatus Bathyarchaeota archaeon]
MTALSGNLEAQIDPRFGRCPYFVIVDSETMEFEAVPNTASGSMSGAGIQAAQTVASKGTGVLITGNVGPNAFQALSAAGIKVVTGTFGNVREVIEKYKSGGLKETSSPTVRGHFGMGTGRGRGRRRW